MVSPTIEILITTIGFAVAKSLVKVWMKEFVVVEEIAGSILDLLKGRTSDLIAARKGSRQFEEIGDRVAKSLEPIFRLYELEAEIDEKTQNRKLNKQAVAEAVALAINSTPITALLLSSFSNNPYKLLAFIKKTAVIPKGLNEVEIALFDRSLELSAQYIVELARNLPDYTASNFTEILKRMDMFSAQFERIISDLDQLRSASDTNSGIEKANFENNYREAVIRNLNHVELLGLESQHFGRRYPLSIAYVSLDVSSSTNVGDNKSSFQDIFHQRVELALSNSRYSVILGEAGSGKTTLLRWLAVNSASNKFEKEMSKWNDTLPFYIELRRFLEDLPSPEHFLDKLAPEIMGMMPNKWCHEMLINRNTVLLIDGLDEVSIKKRDDVSSWIITLSKTFPKMKVVISSRPPGYNAKSYKELDLREFNILPMDIYSIQKFINYWHKAILFDSGIEESESVDQYIHKLSKSFRDHSSLYRLATNPLLCAIICALNYDKKMNIPKDRIELYAACTKLLLDSRDLLRDITIDGFPQLSYKQKLIVISDLAYWMLRNGYSQITMEQALYRIDYCIRGMQLLQPDTDICLVCQMLIERSGVIRQVANNSIDFIHRTFQEYMAAYSIAEIQGDWGALVENSTNDQWRDTIILASGYADMKQADELINGLLEKSQKVEEKQIYLELLAISCLETARTISPAVRSNVLEKMKALIPPKDEFETLSLSAAGDLIVPFLSYQPSFQELDCQNCIYALTTIGTLEALNKIGTYLMHSKISVFGNAEASLVYFTDEQIFASNITEILISQINRHWDSATDTFIVSGQLARCLLKLKPSEIENLHFANFTNVEVVDMLSSTMGIINYFPKLTELKIKGSSFPKISNLKVQNNLHVVDIRCPIDDWSLIRSLNKTIPNIRSLKLITYSDVERFDFNYFGKFKNLELFAITEGTTFDFDNIGKIASLESIHLASSHLLNLQGLNKLNQVRYITISSESTFLSSKLFQWEIPYMDNLKEVIFNFKEVPRDLYLSISNVEKVLPRGFKFIVNEGWKSTDW